MVRHLRREAAAEVGPYGLMQDYYGGPSMVGSGTAVAGAAASTGGGQGGTTSGGTTGGSAPVPAAQAAPGAAPGYSTTNNQEAGVDEPDLVKTDGHLMVVVRQNLSSLQVIDVSRRQPVLRGRLSLHLAGPRAFLLGRKAVVIGETYSSAGAASVVQVIDLRVPRRPRLERTFTVQGSLLDARLLHGRVVLVVRDMPHLRFTSPTNSSKPAVAAALRANRRLVRRTTIRDWLPTVHVSPGKRHYRASCAQALHPGVDSGLATTSLITVDPERRQPTQNVTVVGGSSVIYASTSALYLATSSWQTQQTLRAGRASRISTDLHGFDVAVPDRLRFLGSGSVTGTLTDQYALSEYQGYLRVATTVGTLSPAPGEGVPSGRLSDNRVTVLKPVEGVLVQVGQVKGLGRGEKIYGVRFVGPLAYVVTFRQIDPLHVLDLSDPRHPRARGELKVTGYSSALYPLRDGQLLGVGQGVDAHLRPLGAQVSVFDVRRPARPVLRSRVLLAGGWSLAETDHHSLLWWAPSRLLVIPAVVYSGQFAGSIAYRVTDRGTLREVARVQAPRSAGRCCDAGVQRSVVVGRLLYSVTERGLITNRTDRLTQQAWHPFP
jgi:uncharacterized secreted protein with C-terminal beta-propeller domain